MSKEAEAEPLAMDSPPGSFGAGLFTAGADSQAEALVLDPNIEPKVTISTERAISSTTPLANVSKNTQPVLDLLHWSESPNPNPVRARISATNDSSAFIRASDESAFVQPAIRSEVRTSQPAGGPAGFVAPIQSGNIGRAMTDDYSASPSRSTSSSEMAKQRELIGNLSVDKGDKQSSRRPTSSAKSKELEGSHIFSGSRQDRTVTSKSLASDLYTCQENNAPPRTSVRISNPAGGRSQIVFGCDGGENFGAVCRKGGHNQKAAELCGHEIFKDMATSATNKNNQSERIGSAAKKREMFGNDIFSSPNATEDRPRRARQPPGGESNLKLF